MQGEYWHKIHKCNTCVKKFIKPSKLKRRQKIHENSSTCSHCGKVFRRADHFQMHTMKCATNSNFVPSFCTLQSSLDTEPLPSLDTESLPSLNTEPLPSLDTEPLPSVDENRSQSKGATYKQKS